jgi:hypothetical protein
MITSSANAQEVIFNDDFSGTLQKWQPTRDDARYWSIQNQALQAFLPFGSTVSELTPTSSNLNDVKNFTYELDFTALSGADKNISFGVIDKSNWYEIHFTPTSTQVVKVRNGQVIWSQQYSYILNNSVKYHISIVFNNGLILLFINNEKVFETTDSTFENHAGTIGVKASTGGIFPTKIEIDNVVVRKIVNETDDHDTLLGVRLLKQSDSGWANNEYDSAQSWATPLGLETTIKEWGCNLVSQVMLLQFHGITSFTNGTPISPQSLNTWLLQNNGYYDSPKTGNINKQSISELTAEISKKKGTPKLEFTYVKDNFIEAAVAEISKGNPVILELDGHFVVADGFTADKKDLYIKDPAYDVTKLSQHPLPLKSVRLYTPSQTDLSYISILSSEDVTTEIIQDTTTQQIVSYDEKLRSLSSTTATMYGPVTKITEVAKPTTGDYQLKITNTSATKKTASVVVYTKNGTSDMLLSKEIDPGQHQFNLEYNKEGKSTITASQQQTSFKKLKSTIKLLTETNQIKQAYFGKALAQLAHSADELDKNTQVKVLKVIKAIITSAPHALITRPAKALLLDQIKLLMVVIK